MTRSIVIVDHTDQPPQLLLDVATALTSQVHNHFSKAPPDGWGVAASVRVATTARPPKADEWQLVLLREPDIADAYGYHDRTAAGLPLMKVFPFLDPTSPWSVTASHEVLETLADPELARCVQAPDGRFWALEVCDAVEQDTYEIHGVKVSNFVLPLYFEPPEPLPAGLKFDHLGLIRFPFEMRQGGYGQYWSGTRWRTAERTGKSAVRRAIKEHKLGRAERRQAKTAPYEYIASNIRVIDGDTFVAQLHAGFEHEVDLGFHIIDTISLAKSAEQRIRLAGINAPEIGTDAGKKAKAYLQSLLVTGVRVMTIKQDKYGRWLGLVVAENVDVNKAMLDSGNAVAYVG